MEVVCPERCGLSPQRRWLTTRPCCLAAPVVLWFGGAVRNRCSLSDASGGRSEAIIGAHTRTALLGMIIGLAVAGASMFLGHARVRRTSALLAVVTMTGAALFAPIIVTWLWRGQTMDDAVQLTGRTKVWSEIVGIRRPWVESLWVRLV